jgi:tRNA-dihydrouridine synthase
MDSNEMINVVKLLGTRINRYQYNSNQANWERVDQLNRSLTNVVLIFHKTGVGEGNSAKECLTYIPRSINISKIETVALEHIIIGYSC